MSFLLHTELLKGKLSKRKILHTDPDLTSYFRERGVMGVFLGILDSFSLGRRRGKMAKGHPGKHFKVW